MGMMEIRRAILSKPLYKETATGNPAQFRTNIRAKLPKLIASIDPVQSGTGDPSSSNIRPITGWTGEMISVIGLNMFDVANATVYRRYFKSASGGYTWAPSAIATSYAFPCTPGTTYTVSAFSSGITIFRVGYIKSATIGSTGNITLYEYDLKTAAGSTTITPGTGATYLIIQINSSVVDEGGPLAAMLQIELGDTASPYQVYGDATYSIDWTEDVGTVYGGSFNAVSGILTVTHGEIESYDGETLPSTWISDRDIYAEGSTPTIGAQVVYELADPQTNLLTPLAVYSIAGQNNVQASTGSVDVDYWKS